MFLKVVLMHYKKKGAFQVSLTMIIGVVFAVIILGLAISWITSSFSGISKISDQALEAAKSNLRTTTDQKSVPVLGGDSMRADDEIEATIVIRNNKYYPAVFKIILFSPKYDNKPLFEFGSVSEYNEKEGIGYDISKRLSPDEIGESRFTILGTSMLKEWVKKEIENKGRIKRSVQIRYEIEVCSIEDDKNNCDLEKGTWSYYDGGEMILDILSEK